MRRFRRVLVSFALGLPLVMSLSVALRAEEHGVYTLRGYAIGGYDAVAYFREGRAVRGSPDHALMWRGATWLFINHDNLASFEMNPKSFAPQFGGYCAYALAEGELVGSDPEVFTVHENRLYLNFSPTVRKTWTDDIEGNISRAKDNWPDILKR